MSITESLSKDLVLLNGLRYGEPDAIKALYKDYFRSIVSYLKSKGASEEDAKDVFQETVMVVYRLVQNEGFELRSKLASFLIGISRNIWFKMIRKQANHLDVDDPNTTNQIVDSDEDIVEAIRGRAVDQLFRKKLNALDEQCRQILELFFDGIKMTKIVEALGLSSVAFAKKKKFQCKERLVDLVKADSLYLELKN